MSLATSIKEFSDLLNQISTQNELNGAFSYLTFLQEFFTFSIKNLVSAILYILSFNWLRDFSYLPLLAPQLHPSSYFEDSYFEDPLSHIFSFSRLPATGTAGYGADQLISGFINSFFFSLPFSLPHLISMRRFLSQGVSAGVSSVLGTIAAHSLFLIGVLYGLRFLIIPWFSVEPLNYIVGILIVVAIVNELVQEKKVYIVPRSKQRQVNLLKIGALNFMLTWCEESTVFHSFNHLTLNAHNTYLDLYPSGTASILRDGALNSFIIHTTYLLAFIVGNCLFSFLFYSLFLQSTQYFSQWTGLAIAKVARTLNKVVLLLIVAFALSSFPYYGLDYLLGKVGGFLPEDPAYMESILSPTVIKKVDRDFSDQTTENGKKKVVPLDVNYFDQGVYLDLEAPLEDNPKEDFMSYTSSRARGIEEEVAPTASMKSKNSFEELNYRGEYAWTFHDRYMKKGSEKKTGFLSGLGGGQAFQKPKNHYMELKIKSEKRQAEAARRAADQIPLGRLSEWKEGVLPRFEQGSTSRKDLTQAKLSFEEENRVVTETNPGLVSEANRATTGLKLNRGRAPLELGRLLSSAEQGQLREKPLMIQMEDFLGRSLTSPNRTKVELGLPRARSESGRSSSLKYGLGDIPTGDKALTNQGRSLENEENTFSAGPMSEYVTELTETEFISPFGAAEGEKLLPIENLIKARYIFNPVYRTLLKTDIDAFLARQPSNHNLAANQEYNLAKKRQLLEKYYNWLRYYSPFEKELERLYEIPQTKSFVDSVYNQQFKGTLKITRRLFSVTFNQDQTGLTNLRLVRRGPSQSANSESKEMRKQRRVLSYDQTLYTDSATYAIDDNPFIHEQLLSDKKLSSQTRATTALPTGGWLGAVELGEANSTLNSKSEVGPAPNQPPVGNRATTRAPLELGRAGVNPSTDGAFDMRYNGEQLTEGSSEIDQSSEARARRVRPFEGGVDRPRLNIDKTKSITTFEDLESSADPQNTDNVERDRAGRPRGAGRSTLDSDIELKNKEFSVSRSPFIEESNSSPVYAGWDDTLRQFVVTNQFTLREYK